MKKFIRYVKTCLKLWAIFCSLAICVCLTGCMNIVGHVSEGFYEQYDSTKWCASCIADVFRGRPEWAIALLPVAVVMLPIEAVADTVTFPYDYLKNRNKEND